MKIFDTSSLILVLGDLNRPNLITDFIPEHELIVPNCVFHEIIREPTKKNIDKLIREKKVTISNRISLIEIEEFRSFNPRLGKGECETILLGKNCKKNEEGYCCILDDKQARKSAERIGLKFTGTIGMLQKLVKKGKMPIELYETLLQELEKAGFYIDPKLLKLDEK